MKFEYIREYIALVNNLNFTDTANKLYLTQPALSRHIAALEEEIGAQLLVRTKHNVTLTPAGEMVLEELQKIITQYDELIAKASLLSSGLTGKLKIGMMYYAIDKYFTPIIELFNSSFPSVKLSLFPNQSNQILPSLLNDEIDIAHIFDINLHNSEEICFHNICSEKLVVMVSDNHPFATREMVDISEVLNETIILFPHGDNFSEDLKSKLIEHGFNVQKFFYADKTEQLETLPFLLQETKGIVFLPNHMKNMQRSNVAYVDFENNDFNINSYFAYKMNNSNPVISLFLKQAEQIFASYL